MTAVADRWLEAEFDDKAVKEHFSNLHKAVYDTYDLADIPRYLSEKTFLNGQRFSFKHHEFQLDIASDTSRDINVQKCAQVGLSELMARYAMGATRIMPYFNVILTMPHTKDAQKFCRTRMDPTINESPDLKGAIDPNLNNSEIKSIGTGLLYMRGTKGSTTALSVPADMLIHDEVDRSDPATLGQYQSRLKHSPWKLTRKFGTPTADKVGIALAMEASLRLHHMVKCDKCNHQFMPNYHDHVVIPGFDGDKQNITKHMLGNLRWQEAYLACPKCGRTPSLDPQYREWVCINNMSTYTARGYYVTPFSVPHVVSIPDLVKESTRYESWTEFRNQALGETSADANRVLTEEDLRNAMFEGSLDSGTVHCMGIDVGQTCHILVGRIDHASGMLLVVHKQRCSLTTLRETYLRLRSQYRVIMTVIDSMPETYLVAQLQKFDKNLYGGVYHDNKSLAVYELKRVDENVKEGKLHIHQAKIHRNLNFDEVMMLFKAGLVRWARGANDEDAALFVSHALDMTRIQDFEHNEMAYVWRKSETAQDHFFHTLGYLHVACRLAPTAAVAMPAMDPTSMMRKIAMPSMKEVLQYGR